MICRGGDPQYNGASRRRDPAGAGPRCPPPTAVPRPMHAIHLGNAWDRVAAAGRPQDSWRRRFGRPTGLVPGDRLFLVVERPGLSASATLNGCELPAIAAATARWTCDVTALVVDRNELVFAADGPSPGQSTPAGGEITPAGGGTHGRVPLPAPFGGVGLVIVPHGEAIADADARFDPVSPPRRA
jgi:hypothetical protein